MRNTISTVTLWGLLSICVLAFSGNNTKPARLSGHNFEIKEHISLYSNGKLIGEWQGIGRGRMDGDTYVFKTERGAYSNELRIKGDFIIETTPN